MVDVGVGSVEQPVQHGVELVLFGLFMGLDLVGQCLVDRPDSRCGFGGRDRAERVGSSADLLDVGSD
jgi:hypothetical protein